MKSNHFSSSGASDLTEEFYLNYGSQMGYETVAEAGHCMVFYLQFMKLYVTNVNAILKVWTFII